MVAWWMSSPTRWQPMPRRTYRQRAEREIDRTRNHTRQEFVGWLEELVAANHIPPLLLATPETWDTPARPSICTAISQDSGSWRKSKMPCTRRSSRKMLWCNGFSAKIPKARELLTLSTSLECMFMSSPSWGAGVSFLKALAVPNPGPELQQWILQERRRLRMMYTEDSSKVWTWNFEGLILIFWRFEPDILKVWTGHKRCTSWRRMLAANYFLEDRGQPNILNLKFCNSNFEPETSSCSWTFPRLRRAKPTSITRCSW